MGATGPKPDPREINDSIKTGNDRAKALKAQVDVVQISHVHRQDIEVVNLVVEAYALMTKLMELIETKSDK